MEIKSEIGNRYGRLAVVGSTPRHHSRTIFWNCICDCGASKVVAGTNLRAGNTLSCGCLRRELNKKKIAVLHLGTDRRSEHPLYTTWRKMIDRCQNIKHVKYHLYGGRGIKVCHEWYDFWQFVKDMGDRPEGFTLERKDNELGYSKNNCKWASYAEQNNNRRKFKRK